MKHHIVEPYSPDWHALHLGMPTASKFHRIVTPANWSYSRQARPYAFQLAAEILLRESSGGGLEGVEAMERGKASNRTPSRCTSLPNGFLPSLAVF